jgi:hypothetical protein
VTKPLGESVSFSMLFVTSGMTACRQADPPTDSGPPSQRQCTWASYWVALATSFGKAPCRSELELHCIEFCCGGMGVNVNGGNARAA